MTKQTEALKLALEALELHEKIMHPYCDQQTERALKAIKEALQSNDPELDYKAIGQQAYESGYSTGYMDCAVKMKAQPAVALEQRSVSEHLEPVAWMNPYGGLVHKRITGHERNNFTIPLYTAPPQRTWEGLSVFEINDLVTNTEHGLHELVERTEKLLKEKNT